MPKVAIIYICCHKATGYIHKVADALASSTYPKEDTLLILLPGGAEDGIQDIIKKDILPRSGKDLPETIMIDTGVKAGFGKNNNVGLTYAIEHGYNYLFLDNGDLHIAPDTISSLVQAMEDDTTTASAQPLVCFWNDHDKVNVSGGMIHIAGYGFARDNGASVSEVHYPPISEIAYASGCAVLYRASALQEVGLLEERFFMYHEDLELGLRLMMHGYRNILVFEARAFHDYQFGRHTKMFTWMEIYRWIVMLAYLRIPTLILFTPLLLAIEIGTWLMAAKGGWLAAKKEAYKELLTPRSWKLMRSLRLRAQQLRAVPDRTLLMAMTGKIEGQQDSGIFMDKVANPIIDAVFKTLRYCVRW